MMPSCTSIFLENRNRPNQEVIGNIFIGLQGKCEVDCRGEWMQAILTLRTVKAVMFLAVVRVKVHLLLRQAFNLLFQH